MSSHRSKSDRHRYEKPPRSGYGSNNGTGSRSYDHDELSFLFVVNELVPARDDFYLDHDEWHNTLPPILPNQYRQEIPSRVMRYRDGTVTEATKFYWGRSELGMPGDIVYLLDNIPTRAEPYRVQAVFSCNPQLPFVVMCQDPLIHSQSPPQRRPLMFYHPPEHPGLSQAGTDLERIIEIGSEDEPGPVKYVARSRPSWIPALLPRTYLHPRSQHTSSSRETDGELGGELSIVIALMAFSEAGDFDTSKKVEEIFLGSKSQRHGRWHDRKWTHPYEARGYSPSAQHDPRGFLVAVYLDPANRGGSTREKLQHFERHKALVKDS